MSEETQEIETGGEELNMKQLLEAGAHFGHQKSYWNPKMKSHIFGVRNGVHIIDLQKTVGLFKIAYQFIFDLTSKGGTVLFVGTKQQARGIIREESEKCAMPYVNVRWLGGTLTNFGTIRSRLQYMDMLKKLEKENKMQLLPKKEVVRLGKEKAKLSSLLGGLVSLKRLPDAVFIVDTKKEINAFKEARKLGIPIVGLVDTNCDPSEIDYVIPTNDDAMRAIKLFTSKIAEACAEGRKVYEETVKDMPEEERREQCKEQQDGPIVEKKMYVFKKFGEDEEQEDERKLNTAASETPGGEAGSGAAAKPEDEGGKQV